MISDIIIIDEPFIWIGSLKKGNTLIELSKLTHQQCFLIGNNPEALVEYYQKISESEVRKIDEATAISPFTQFKDFNLLFINLN
jgi:hypothetical protein